jgi:2-polyprenyl-3-methyl-5-hydroxy-6-metoxy-1,4-benzoquinol methylase
MMIEATTQPSTEYDSQYQIWLSRQGARALELDWRLRHLLWRQRALLRRYSPEGKRVLDVGCMDGVFTIRLQQLGADAVGYDLSPAAIAQAEKFRGPAMLPKFTTVAPGPGQFDLVYCNEVLEHVPDETAFLGEVVGFLAPGGVVVGTTPVGRGSGNSDGKRVYDQGTLERALAPWGAVRIRVHYRTPIRNLLPFRQAGAAVFIFEVRPPSLRDSH